MFQRHLVSQLVSRMQEPRRFIQIVVGPRQTGKTTAITQTLESLDLPHYYVSADDPLLASAEWLKNEWSRARELAQNQDAIFILDEAQKIKNWSAAVKEMWDEDSLTKTPLKIILSGSSSLLLRKGMEESLKGRFEVLYCPHWNLSECRDAFGYDLDTFLLFGGYPGAASLVGDTARWARYLELSIVEPTISQDILMIEEVRKPALLRALFSLGARYSAQELSYTKILGQLQDAGNTTTLAHYLDLLDKANMLCGLQKYSASKARVQKSSPRFMVYDTALMTYRYGADLSPFWEDPELRGHLVESTVGACLLARSQEEGFKVYWYREREKEVDFVIERGGKLTGIEVKSGRIKSTAGAADFLRKFPEALLLIVGSSHCSLEDFLLGRIPLFK